MGNNKTISAVCFLLCIIMMITAASCGYDENDNQVTAARLTSATTPSSTDLTDKSTNKTTAKASDNESTQASGRGTQTTAANANSGGSNRVIYSYTGKTNPRITIPQNVQMLSGYSGMRDVSARQIVADMRVGLCIDDYIDTIHIDESRFYSLIHSTKQSGYNAIRLLVSFENHMKGSSVDVVYLQKVKSSVDAAIDNKMYCILTDVKESKIIDVESRNAFDGSRLHYSQLWQQVATYFKSYGDKLLFGGYDLTPDNTELNATATMYNYANMLNNDFVSAVRSTGGNNEVRHLVVSTFQSMADNSALNAFKRPNDSANDRIIANVQLFSPEGFCNIDDYKNNDWGTALEQNMLETKLATLNNALYKNKNCPVIVGKFGAADKNNSSQRAFYASCFVMSAYNYGITCFWFDNNADYRLFDRYTAKPYYTDIISSMVVASK